MDLLQFIETDDPESSKLLNTGACELHTMYESIQDCS